MPEEAPYPSPEAKRAMYANAGGTIAALAAAMREKAARASALASREPSGDDKLPLVANVSIFP